jgi:hypothetical protein
MCRIIGKSGVPSIRLSHDGVARIDVKDNEFTVKDYEANPKVLLDTELKRATFNLKRDSYTPVAVLKAFTKFGLTLVPANSMDTFELTRKWILNPDHDANFVAQIPLIHTFISGPMPNDRIGLNVFIRKQDVNDVPYAFYTMSYGNEMFQVFIPCPIKDQILQDSKLTILAYPNDVQLGRFSEYKFGTQNLNLTGRERIKGEVCPIGMHFDQIEIMDTAIK